jgi:heme O synthase-like polyprenyltransferase
MRRASLISSLCKQFANGLDAAGGRACTAGSPQPVSLLPGAARWFSSQPVATAAAAAATEAAPSGLRRAKRVWQNYKKLSKFRLSMLVVATSSAGYVAGSKEKINWAGMGWTSLGTFLASASANALNQVYEVVNDGRMKRTMARPLPTGRMSRAHALVFAAVTGVGGVYLLLEKVRIATNICLGQGATFPC